SSRRRHTRFDCDWSSDVCSSDLNIKSASKSLISALIGVAIDRGFITSVRQPLATWFSELNQDRDRRKAAITVEDLLTMRAGLESDRKSVVEGKSVGWGGGWGVEE